MTMKLRQNFIQHLGSLPSSLMEHCYKYVVGWLRAKPNALSVGLNNVSMIYIMFHNSPLYSQEKDVLPLWDVLFALCGDRDEQWAVVYRVILELMRLSEQTILLLSSLPSIVGGMSKVCMFFFK